MKSTGLILDLGFTEHDTGLHHPEAPGRIKAIDKQLKADQLVNKCQKLEVRQVEDDELLLVHTPAYLATVEREIDGSTSGILSTGDTQFGPSSKAIAREAAGSLLNAVDQVMTDKLTNAFCAVRPPGHHATADKGMGFCIYNNIAIAANYARKKHGAERVAIVDWDVHHGNGTQDIFYQDPGVFFFSTHQHPFYPGTGLHTETGSGKGKQTTLNVPLAAGSGMQQVEGAFRKSFTEKMKAYKPDLVLISAGFDSRIHDPLGDFTLTDDDFVSLTKILLEIAGEYAESRVVSVLEGGYNQEGLGKAVSSHVGALMEAGS